MGAQSTKEAVTAMTMKAEKRYSPKNSYLLHFFLCVVFFCGQVAMAQTNSQNTPKYRNPNLTVEERVADLLPRMTLEEKVAQLSWTWQRDVQVIDSTGTYTTEAARKAVASEWNPDFKLTPRNAAILRNAVQRYQLEKTRLGIPTCSWGRRCTDTWNTEAPAFRRHWVSPRPGIRRL